MLDLPALVSEARFAEYLTWLKERPHLSENRDLTNAATGLYFWDMHVSSSLLPSISFTEVILRNAMNEAICNFFATDPEEGWIELVDDGIDLTDRDRETVSGEYARMSRRLRRAPTGNEFVGKSTLGIWVMLLDRGDSGPGRGSLNYHTQIWGRYLNEAFPLYGRSREDRVRGRARVALLERVRQFSVIRNRVAHHNPMFRKDVPRTVENMAQILAYIDGEASTHLLDNEMATTAASPETRRRFLDGEWHL